MDTPDTLAAELLKAGAVVAVAARKATQKGANNIKTQARKNTLTAAPVHNAGAAQTINYDTDFTRTGVTAEIGYDRAVRKAANLAIILEYGTRKNPPQRNLGRALDDEEPRFVQAIAEVGALGLTRGTGRL